MRRIIFPTFSLLAAFSCGPAIAQEHILACNTLNDTKLSALEKKYELNGIRVFYTEQPPVVGAEDHRLPSVSQVDANTNGVPDFIENIALQADTTRKMYNALGFRDPLEAAHYRVVEVMDVNVYNMANNGLAYDGAVRYPAAPGRGDVCTLRIDISANLELSGKFTTNWFVVGHEMFHLFQYGQTLFKRGWVNEPTAKWGEYASRVGPFYPLSSSGYTLPDTYTAFSTDVINASTSATANRFWSRLIDLVESEDSNLRVPDYLLGAKYVDGNSVIKDETLRGAAIISTIYQTLDAEDDIVSNQNGWSPYTWSESNQTSSAHDPRILSVIQRTVQKTGVSNPELDAFLAITP